MYCFFLVVLVWLLIGKRESYGNDIEMGGSSESGNSEIKF